MQNLKTYLACLTLVLLASCQKEVIRPNAHKCSDCSDKTAEQTSETTRMSQGGSIINENGDITHYGSGYITDPNNDEDQNKKKKNPRGN